MLVAMETRSKQTTCRGDGGGILAVKALFVTLNHTKLRLLESWTLDIKLMLNWNLHLQPHIFLTFLKLGRFILDDIKQETAVQSLETSLRPKYHEVYVVTKHLGRLHFHNSHTGLTMQIPVCVNACHTPVSPTSCLPIYSFYAVKGN